MGRHAVWAQAGGLTIHSSSDTRTHRMRYTTRCIFVDGLKPTTAHRERFDGSARASAFWWLTGFVLGFPLPGEEFGIRCSNTAQ